VLSSRVVGPRGIPRDLSHLAPFPVTVLRDVWLRHRLCAFGPTHEMSEGSHIVCHERRVLVVEDTPAVRQLLVLALTDEGYRVQAAVHGAHALQLLETLAPCLILLDLRMPVLDGYGFARAYRARDDADAHLIVMTAEARPGPLDAIKPVQVVRKPFDLEHLLPNVEHWVRAHPSRAA